MYVYVSIAKRDKLIIQSLEGEGKWSKARQKQTE